MTFASYGKGINKVWNKVRWIMGNNMTDFLQHSSTAQQHNRDNITEFTAKRDGDDYHNYHKLFDSLCLCPEFSLLGNSHQLLSEDNSQKKARDSNEINESHYLIGDRRAEEYSS